MAVDPARPAAGGRGRQGDRRPSGGRIRRCRAEGCGAGAGGGRAAQARAELARIRAAGRPEEIAAQRARIEALHFAEASARRDAERAEALVPSGAGGVATAERARFAAARAAAERAEAEASLQRLLVPRPEDLAVAEAELARPGRRWPRPAAMPRCRGWWRRSPAPSSRSMPGPATRSAATGCWTMADLDRIDVVADVYETDLPRLRPGAGAEVTVAGRPAALRRDGAGDRLAGPPHHPGRHRPGGGGGCPHRRGAAGPGRGRPRGAGAADQHAGPGGDPAMNAIPRKAPAPAEACCPGRRSGPGRRAPPRRRRRGRSPRPLVLPLRLAWRQLLAERARLASAIAGVMFACVLVFMQLGFRAALFDSATALRRACRGTVPDAPADPGAVPAGTDAAGARQPDPGGGGGRAAVPVYLAQAAGGTRENGSRRAVQLVGFDTEAGVSPFPAWRRWCRR